MNIKSEARNQQTIAKGKSLKTSRKIKKEEQPLVKTEKDSTQVKQKANNERKSKAPKKNSKVDEISRLMRERNLFKPIPRY